MNFADAREGLHIRFSHHNGSRSGGKAAPVFRLRPAIAFTHDAEGLVATAHEEGWERVVVVPFPPYHRDHALPFTPANAAQFVTCGAPLRKVTAPSTRTRRGTR